MSAEGTHPWHQRRRTATYRRITSGTFLIAIGTVLLLNTLGRLGWGVWFDLIRLWPVLLIALGVRLIFVRTRLHLLCLIGPTLIALSTIAVVLNHDRQHDAWAASLHEAPPVGFDCPASPGKGPRRLDLRFDTGILRLVSVGPGPSGKPAGDGTLEVDPTESGFHGSILYEGETPSRSCGKGGSLRLGRIRPAGTVHVLFPFRWSKRRWEARLAAPRPVKLDVRLAAAAADLDLRSFVLEGVDLRTIASRVVLRLASPRGRVPIRVDGSVSSLKVVVPEGTCFTVSRRQNLSILNVEDASSHRSRARRVTADACGGSRAGPRYEISCDLPVSTVSIETETADV